jgi:hypothetical protein
MYQPIILAGHVDAPLEDGSTVRVRIHHAHLEEDAGKLTHFGEYSLVDLNRAGTPLIEIVSEPDIHSAAAARAYATELYRLMTYGEVTYNATSGEGKFVTEPYQMTTIKQEGAYIVKLYGYPVWVDSTVGYQMKWFLYNLDRGVSFEVTPYVYPGTTGDTFDGKAYGKVQNLTVRLNLRDVSMSFKSYQHAKQP